MTAEIAILNKNGIALAADSAITVDTSRGRKAYHSANKLFALSKYEPVGVMLYNNASLIGVPWELLIKRFRRELGETRYGSLPEYAEEFVRFLDNGNPCFPTELQAAYFEEVSLSRYLLIQANIRDEVARRLHTMDSIDPAEIAVIVREEVEEDLQFISAADPLPHLPNDYPDQLLGLYSSIIDGAIEVAFEDLPLDEGVKEMARRVPALLMSRRIASPDHTGIVVAGYGQDEIYPTYVELIIDGVAGERLKYGESSPKTVSPLAPVIVRPFAQREMVDTFMQGLNPDYEVALNQAIHASFDKYAEAVIDAIPGLTDEVKAETLAAVRAANIGVVEELSNKMRDYRDMHYVRPIIETVAVLAKDELADMAESLVGLTSLKRRVSETVETVGGPVDVAVITKGDGLIWIRRKHYFSADLNPHFFANYYRP